MSEEQIRLEALKQAVRYCGRRDLGGTEMLWYADQFIKFLKGKVHE